MSVSFTNAITTARWLLVAVMALSSTGCLSMLGRQHSSLRPKTASTWEPDSSVFRSQDERLADRPAMTIRAGKPATINPSVLGVAGHSLPGTDESKPSAPPTARLLQPAFVSTPTQPAGVRTKADYSGIIIQPQQAGQTAAEDLAGQSSDSAAAESKGSGHSIGFTADHIRQFMNEQSRNDMSEGRVLSERKSKWQVLDAGSTASDNQIPPSGGNSVALTTEEIQSVAVPLAEPPVLEASRTKELAPSAETSVEEPSMLDRLRGFYGPSTNEQKSRQRWMKQFQKLPSPWSVFRDKESTATPSSDQSPLPPQTVELPDDPEGAAVDEASVAPLLSQLIAGINDELQSWPRSPAGVPENLSAFQRREQDLRLLYLIANQPGAAVAAIDSLPNGDQDFWQEVMLGLAQYRAEGLDVPREQRLANTAGQLRTAVRRLAPLSALRIRRVDICSQIYSFGRVETFSLNEFDPGDPILLYVELENFASRLTATGSYETSFDAEIRFYEENTDEPIETIELAEITDQSTSERADYYQSFELTVPSHLTSGRYRIEVKLRDRTSGKKAQESVSFRVR